MKDNETIARQELESINSELFHSFDPEEASWISGGRLKITSKVTKSGDTPDVEFDIEFEI